MFIGFLSSFTPAVASSISFQGVRSDLEISCSDPLPPPTNVVITSTCDESLLDLSAGRILYYPFDQQSGGIVLDASGFGRTGIVHGATWVAEGARGGAYRFDNLHQNITATDIGLPSGDQPRSLVMWVKLDKIYTEDSTEYFSYGTRNFNQLVSLGFDWRLDRDKFNFSQYGGVNLSQQKMDQPGIWMHIAYTYNGNGTHHIYINGILSDGHRELFGQVNSIPGGQLTLGGHPQNASSLGPEGGYLDEVMIYNRALSLEEVNAIYHQFLPAAFGEIKTGTCPAVIYRIWKAQDLCGNSASEMQTIHLLPQEAVPDEILSVSHPE